jgi:HEAT repeat protein
VSELGPVARPVVPALLKQAAYGAVARLEPKALLAVVRDGAKGPDPSFYEHIADLRGSLAEVEPGLIGLLEHADAAVRVRAAWVVGRLGRETVNRALPQLKKMLAEKDGSVRWAAVGVLHEARTELKLVVPVLERFLKDPKRSRGAVRRLSELGPAGKAAVPVLIEMLQTPEEDDPIPHTIGMLGSLGPAAEPAVPFLTNWLRDEDDLTRYLAVRALRAIGPGARKAVPELVRLLTDSAVYVRAAVVRALGEIGGPDAVRAVPKLVALFDDQFEFIREAAAESVKRLAPDVAKKAGIR